MFKASGAAHQLSDTDSEDERERAYVNKRAVKRWNKKKELQKQDEQKKNSKAPSQPTDKTKKETVGGILLIGDTSQGKPPANPPETYIRAYQSYKQQTETAGVPTTQRHSRTKSAPLGQKNREIDPITYEEWVSGKPCQNVSQTSEENKEHKPKLVKRIDYKTWLDAANKKINKQIALQKKEEKQKQEFKEWIQELKDEVGTFEYWKRRKEEQIAREKKARAKRLEDLKQKSLEATTRKELAKDIYKHWSVSKEKSTLQQEQNKLKKEKERLKKAREAK